MYKKKGHIHFIGIGGIGMSGIATILKQQGYEISGCDLDLNQQSIADLQKLGCAIYEGNNTKKCHDTSIEVFVYSAAIKVKNPEIIAAQKRAIPTISRALMLAELMRTKFSIAVSGAHGKTTTTSLISHILIEAKKDPTVIIGGNLNNISSNARLGTGDFLVAEVDESDRSFLYLPTTLAVITNIDLEHLETYTDIDDIKNTFKQFIQKIPFYGKAFVCIENAHIQSILPFAHIKTVKYGFDKNKADIYAQKILLYPDYSTFMVYEKNKANPLGSITLNMPGQHNVLNALAAIAIAQDLEISFDIIARALQNFRGIDRRFTFKGTYKGTEIFDDYGHHPEEIRNTLLVARRRTKSKIIVIFQPHRYTRTHHLWDQFIEIFLQSLIDHLIITDIYPASELPIIGVSSEILVKALVQKNPGFSVEFKPYDFESILEAIEKVIQPNDLLLFLGAGTVNRLANILCKNYHT